MRHLVMPLLAAVASVLSTAPASADLGDQLFKLLADDGVAGDRFGISVAINGSTAVVGADLNEDIGGHSGSAYLFDTTSGGQIAKLLADDGTEGDRFGHSVAINGATAIVGAYSHEDNGFLSGSAYLFDTTTGRQTAKLLPNDGAAGDRFGRSVAIGTTTAIVGAYSDYDNGELSGSAYLFDTTTGQQIAKLLANDGAAGDRFGYSLAISGATAIIGAYADDDNGSNSGSAYLFDISDPANPLQTAKLLPKDGAVADWFGFSVAISGTTAIVGAFTDAHKGLTSGSAYLFDTTTGLQIAKILPNDGATNDQFGYSVAISGVTAIVGTHRDDDNGFDSGSAYIVDASSCPWDLDENGSVGVSDLLSLLGSWGPCPPKGDCPADFDDSGDVGVKDLLILLGNWGPCP